MEKRARDGADDCIPASVLEEIVVGDPELKGYLEKMTPYQRQILSDPSLYTGIAAKKARAVDRKSVV